MQLSPYHSKCKTDIYKNATIVRKVLGYVFFNLYLPFNIVIAAVSPIQEHGSEACFGTIQAYMNHVTTLPARSESVATLLSLALHGPIPTAAGVGVGLTRLSDRLGVLDAQ